MGQAFARHFAADGAALILTDVDEPGLERVAATLKEQGAQCSTHRVDLGNESEIRQFAAQIAEWQERLDVLVNNAAIAYGEVAHAFETLNQAQWLQYLAINTVAPLLLAQALRT